MTSLAQCYKFPQQSSQKQHGGAFLSDILLYDLGASFSLGWGYYCSGKAP